PPPPPQLLPPLEPEFAIADPIIQGSAPPPPPNPPPPQRSSSSLPLPPPRLAEIIDINTISKITQQQMLSRRSKTSTPPLTPVSGVGSGPPESLYSIAAM